jgi:hypothetical protein
MDYRISTMIFQIQKPIYLMQIQMTPAKLKCVYDRRIFAFDDSFLAFFYINFQRKRRVYLTCLKCISEGQILLQQMQI